MRMTRHHLDEGRACVAHGRLGKGGRDGCSGPPGLSCSPSTCFPSPFLCAAKPAPFSSPPNCFELQARSPALSAYARKDAYSVPCFVSAVDVLASQQSRSHMASTSSASSAKY